MGHKQYTNLFDKRSAAQNQPFDPKQLSSKPGRRPTYRWPGLETQASCEDSKSSQCYTRQQQLSLAAAEAAAREEAYGGEADLFNLRFDVGPTGRTLQSTSINSVLIMVAQPSLRQVISLYIPRLRSCYLWAAAMRSAMRWMARSKIASKERIMNQLKL